MRLPLSARLPVHPRTPGRARALLTEWLSGGWCTTATTDDLLLAVNEAVTNSVEHAYPPGHDGVVIVEAVAVESEHGGTRAVVTVADTGQWRPEKTDTGFRGRGLAMMEAMVQRLQIIRTATGTKVRMTSRPCKPDDEGQ